MMGFPWAVDSGDEGSTRRTNHGITNTQYPTPAIGKKLKWTNQPYQRGAAAASKRLAFHRVWTLDCFLAAVHVCLGLSIPIGSVFPVSDFFESDETKFVEANCGIFLTIRETSSQ